MPLSYANPERAQINRAVKPGARASLPAMSAQRESHETLISRLRRGALRLSVLKHALAGRDARAPGLVLPEIKKGRGRSPALKKTLKLPASYLRLPSAPRASVLVVS